MGPEALHRRSALRRAVVAGIAAIVVGGVALTVTIRASDGSGIAPRTGAQLVADLGSAPLGPLTGTVTEHADLRFVLPAPCKHATQGCGPLAADGTGSSQFDSLVSGSHTLRMWWDGQDRERIALVGTLGESDIIRNGPDMWIWSSTGNTVTHYGGPPGPASGTPAVSRAPLTPGELTTALLRMMSPSTAVTTRPSTTIAGRPAHVLQIDPDGQGCLIDRIRIAVDAETHVALRVQVYGTHDKRPAFELGFTQISFGAPDPSVFGFNPPPGVHVRAEQDDATAGIDGALARHIAGSGWTSVVEMAVPFTDHGPGGQGDGTIDLATAAARKVKGPWGTGYLIETRLFTTLLVPGNRMFIGAVGPAAVQRAARSAY